MVSSGEVLIQIESYSNNSIWIRTSPDEPIRGKQSVVSFYNFYAFNLLLNHIYRLTSAPPISILVKSGLPLPTYATKAISSMLKIAVLLNTAKDWNTAKDDKGPQTDILKISKNDKGP